MRCAPGGMHLDEHFVRPERRPGNVGKHNVNKPAVAFQNQCFHFLVWVPCLCSSVFWVFMESVRVKLTTESSV